MKSHKKGAGGRYNRSPHIIIRSPGRTYQVLPRVPQYPGEPEHAVSRGEASGEVVALFFNAVEASNYARWQNGRRAKP